MIDQPFFDLRHIFCSHSLSPAVTLLTFQYVVSGDNGELYDSSRKSEAQLRRLSENRTTSPTLREGDLLVANLLPVSKLIHQFSIIVYADGRFESSERLHGTQTANSIYHKETGELASEMLAMLRSLLEGYAVLAKAVEDFVSSNAVDPFESESKDRRTLAFFADREGRGVSRWMLNYCSGHRERPEAQEKFNEIWIVLANIPEFRKFDFDEGFSCPAYTK